MAESMLGHDVHVALVTNRACLARVGEREQLHHWVTIQTESRCGHMAWREGRWHAGLAKLAGHWLGWEHGWWSLIVRLSDHDSLLLELISLLPLVATTNRYADDDQDTWETAD